MTKAEILDFYEDINYVYNNPYMLRGLEYRIDSMIDELIEDAISQIEQARDKDKIAEYPYNRCIEILRRAVDEN